jgi:hypothetical protein
MAPAIIIQWGYSQSNIKCSIRLLQKIRRARRWSRISFRFQLQSIVR